MATKILPNSVSKRKLSNGTSTKVLEETRVTNGTDDTDIIEYSLIENEKEQRYKFWSNSGVKSKSKSCIQNKRENEKEINFTPSRAVTQSIRISLQKSFQLLNDPCKSPDNSFNALETPLKTPESCGKPESERAHRRLLSSLKKIPGDIPYLSKTKLNNIERWLEYNDFEILPTPPFANLSITPTRGVKTQIVNRRKEKQQFDSSGSLDSETEGVLKAVYGNDWLDKNFKAKCKTEPKRRIKKNVSSPSSLRKGKLEGSKSLFTRRSILKVEKIDLAKDEDEDKNLEDSILSGVGMINLNDSSGSLDRLRMTDLKNDLQKGKTRERSKRSKVISSPASIGKTSAKGVRSNVTKSRNKGQVTDPGDSVPSKTPKRTFLASLSVSTPTTRCHPDAKYYKVNFKSKKDELVAKLYKLYNSEVFEGGLPDDMNFSWNVKLRGTAGYCYNKRLTKSTGEVIRNSRIEFSTKIVDRADRLRDTMIHELCHAASWVIDGMLDGHGAVWSGWATKAMRRFPELPQIKRCHNFDIVSKYVYRCTGCGYSIKRHSKSINTERKRCGYCYGTLELLLNKKRKGKTEVPEFDATRTMRTPNRFAIFVKENYHTVRSTRTEAKHAEIMKILSQQYALTKTDATSSTKKLNL